MSRQGLEIFCVKSNSIAQELRLAPGDRIVTINGEPVRDVIDMRFLESDEYLELEVVKYDGSVWELDIEKDYDEVLGIDFGPNNFSHTINCINKCLFCFVDQMPPNMRNSLYVKDDDYRRSFWEGTFITLTNLTESMMRRITAQRLSPLYVSVHTTNPTLRQRMLGNKQAGRVLEQLQYLAKSGIEIHTQVVLCPDLNDCQELDRTLSDLVSLWPAVQSMAVVPVGLTKFQKNRVLRPFRGNEAKTLVDWLALKQESFLSRLGNPFIFASDEFYLLSNTPVPPGERYAGYPQLENGVGLTRLFLDEWETAQADLPSRLPPLKATIVTSVLGAEVLQKVVLRLNQVIGLEVTLAVIENHYFGRQITVTGLLTGTDLLNQLNQDQIGDLLILPKVMLKKDEDIFLDDITLSQLTMKLQKPIRIARGPKELVRTLMSYK